MCRLGTHKQFIDMEMNRARCRATARVMSIKLNPAPEQKT
ncbi:IS1-like element transposase [Xenorhabdus hominickii]